MKYLFFTFLFFIQFASTSQSNFFVKSDSLNSGRFVSISSGIALTWGLGSIGMYETWYSDYPSSKFHTFNDAQNWLQMDKMGHFYTTNKFSMVTADLFQWSGLSNRRSALIGASVGLGLQTTLEVMDGYSSGWGFSWSDMTFNIAGALSFAAQQVFWEEQRFIFKFSYQPTPYAAIRPLILGSTFTESFLKDYNGQTYWMSFSPASFFKSSKIPKWICLSLGYSVDQKLVGDEEEYYDLTSGISYHSQREYIFSLDIDFTKIEVNRPVLKALFKQLNHIKVPFPAIIYSNGRFSGQGLYF